MNDASKFAGDKLRAASRDRDRSRRLALALGTGAAALLLLLAVAALDYWIMLPAPVRLIGMALLALLIGLGVARLVRTLRQPTRMKDAALDAEARSPELGCELSTAAEYLAGERKVTQEYEADLAAALQEKAAQNLKKIELPYGRQTLRPAMLLGAVAFGALVFGLMASGALTAFKRAAFPWSKVTYTQVEVKPGNLEVPVGKDVEIKSVFSGRLPKEARIGWQDEGSAKWQFASLTRTEGGEYVYPVKNIRTGLKYRVSGSDAVSPEFTVDAYVPPEVKGWTVDLNYPAYTRKDKATQTSPELSVLRGTTASFKIAPSTKLAKARLRFKDLPPIELKQGADDLWQGNLSIAKDTDFWIEMADAKGHTGGNEQPFHIKALPDDAPKVEITEPGEDMRAEATNTVPVKILASDDYGISEVRLVYHKLGSAEQFVTAARKGETNTELSAEIPLSAMGLKMNEIVAYHAEATDNNTLDGPGVGKSEVFFIEITDMEGCKCKSPKPPKGQKVNLLVIQKQIISDTSALAANAPPAKFEDLAKRQKDAQDFGKMYLEAMSAGGAPPEATQEMEAAVADMEKAQASLEKRERTASLLPEESALARLYRLLSMAPQLANLPTVPKPPEEKKEEKDSPMVKVVLDAIKKKQKEQPDNKELAQALEEAKKLEEQQEALLLGVQNPGTGSGEAEKKIDRTGKKSAQAKSGKGKGQGQPKDGEPKEGEGKEGKEMAAKEGEKGDKPGEGDKPGQGNKPGQGGKPGDPKEAQKLAEKENELSKEAQALAEKLGRMAGKDARLGHGAGKKMGDAAKKMAQAAQAMGQGKGEEGGIKGGEGAESLGAAIAILERVLNDRPELADVSKEESPKAYEAAIADYLKKLSYAE